MRFINSVVKTARQKLPKFSLAKYRKKLSEKHLEKYKLL